MTRNFVYVVKINDLAHVNVLGAMPRSREDTNNVEGLKQGMEFLVMS